VWKSHKCLLPGSTREETLEYISCKSISNYRSFVVADSLDDSITKFRRIRSNVSQIDQWNPLRVLYSKPRPRSVRVDHRSTQMEGSERPALFRIQRPGREVSPGLISRVQHSGPRRVKCRLVENLEYHVGQVYIYLRRRKLIDENHNWILDVP